MPLNWYPKLILFRSSNPKSLKNIPKIFKKSIRISPKSPKDTKRGPHVLLKRSTPWEGFGAMLFIIVIIIKTIKIIIRIIIMIIICESIKKHQLRHRFSFDFKAVRTSFSRSWAPKSIKRPWCSWAKYVKICTAPRREHGSKFIKQSLNDYQLWASVFDRFWKASEAFLEGFWECCWNQVGPMLVPRASKKPYI